MTINSSFTGVDKMRFHNPIDYVDKRFYKELAGEVSSITVVAFPHTEHNYLEFAETSIRFLKQLPFNPDHKCTRGVWGELDEDKPLLPLYIMRVFRNQRLICLGLELEATPQALISLSDFGEQHNIGIPIDTVALNRTIAFLAMSLEQHSIGRIDIDEAKENYLGTGINENALRAAAQVVHFCLETYPLESLSIPRI